MSFSSFLKQGHLFHLPNVSIWIRRSPGGPAVAQAPVPGAARALGWLSRIQSSPSQGSPAVSSPAHTLGSVRVPAAEPWPELLAASFPEHLICSLGFREARDRAAVVRACCVLRQACSFSTLGRLLESREMKRQAQKCLSRELFPGHLGRVQRATGSQCQ